MLDEADSAKKCKLIEAKERREMRLQSHVMLRFSSDHVEDLIQER